MRVNLTNQEKLVERLDDLKKSEKTTKPDDELLQDILKRSPDIEIPKTPKFFEPVYTGRSSCALPNLNLPPSRETFMMRGQPGPWVFQRPDRDLAKEIIMMSIFSLDFDIPYSRVVITGLCDGPEDITKHPEYWFLRKVVTVQMTAERLVKAGEIVEKVKRKEAEAFGKVIWLGLRWLGVV